MNSPSKYNLQERLHALEEQAKELQECKAHEPRPDCLRWVKVATGTRSYADRMIRSRLNLQQELDMYITSYCIRNRKMDRIEYLTKKSLHKKRKWVKHMKGKEQVRRDNERRDRIRDTAFKDAAVENEYVREAVGSNGTRTKQSTLNFNRNGRGEATLNLTARPRCN